MPRTMSKKADRLLARARASKADWTRRELDQLYRAFGFEIRHGSKHDIVVHPEHPELRATLTRSDPLAIGYITWAVKMIEALQEREGI